MTETDSIQARTTVPCAALKSFMGCVSEVAPTARVGFCFSGPLRLACQAFNGDRTVYVDVRLMMDDEEEEGPTVAVLLDAKDLVKRIKAFDAKKDISLAVHVNDETTVGLRQGAVTRLVKVQEPGDPVKGPPDEELTAVIVDADLPGLEKFLREVESTKTSSLVVASWDGTTARFTAEGAKAKDTWEAMGEVLGDKRVEAKFNLARLLSALKAALLVGKVGLVEFGNDTSLRVTVMDSEVAATILVAGREG